MEESKPTVEEIANAVVASYLKVPLNIALKENGTVFAKTAIKIAEQAIKEYRDIYESATNEN